MEMQLSVDPRLNLIRALIPGELVTLREARRRADMSESALAESVAVLTTVLPELATPPGALRLTGNPDLLDPGRFCECLPDSLIARLSQVAVYAVCESTSNEVISIGAPMANTMNIALTEFQTGGRGRQGRSWNTGFAEGVCLTLAARMAPGVRIQPTLTLAIGVQIAKVLDTYLAERVLLKWPNDLILADGKLGGILVELSNLPGGDHVLRIGVGVNCVVPEAVRMSGDLPALPPTALADYAQQTLDRTQLAADIVSGIVDALDTHQLEGFDAFHSSWQDRDYLRHQHVQVFDDERVRHGTATGIDQHGALQVTTDEGTLSLMSGEVRVRRR